MNKIGKTMGKLVTVVLILVIPLLAACNATTQVMACHATGDPTKPYEEVAIDSTNLQEHLAHAGDIYPVPVGGCPANQVETTDGKITICHATGDKTAPYNEITVSVNGLNGHDKHNGDIIPVPEGGCPVTPLEIVDGMIAICHATGDVAAPYEEIKVSVNDLDGHSGHVDDIYPVPVNGCPTIPVVVVDGNITICHANGNDTVPYDEITVPAQGLDDHATHEGDIIPAPEGGCPDGLLEITDGKITICHANGSQTNAYNEITVSVNGLNGHGNHVNDIIPLPEGGCPDNLLNVNDGKITICHATSSDKNPYNLITISLNGLNGHGKHSGDIIPAPGWWLSHHKTVILVEDLN